MQDAGRRKAALQAALFLAGPAAACTGIVAVRALLGFRFPVPWPDETYFVSPAFAFSQTGSFFVPGLNPDRVVMWMPPGYMLVLAALFRVFGYSFAFARWISAAFMAVSLRLVTHMAWRAARGWWRPVCGVAVGAAFLAPACLIVANVARMDAMFCCLILLAMTMCVRGRAYSGVAIVLAAATVHFNAIYFLPATLACAVLQLPPWRPDRRDTAMIAASLVIVAAYCAYAVANWSAFVPDMHAQFARKAMERALPHGLMTTLVLLAGLVLAAIRIVRSRTESAGDAGLANATCLFGSAFLLMPFVGRELWYLYGAVLGPLLIFLGILVNARHAPAARLMVAAASLLSLAGVLQRNEVLNSLLPRADMLHRGLVAPSELDRVRRFIASLPAADTVGFGTPGFEPFFLRDFARSGATWILLPHSVTQFFPARAAAWSVRCDSPDLPGSVIAFDNTHPRQGKDTGCQIFKDR